MTGDADILAGFPGLATSVPVRPIPLIRFID